MTKTSITYCGLDDHAKCGQATCKCPCHKHDAWGQMGPEWKTAYAGA